MQFFTTNQWKINKDLAHVKCQFPMTFHGESLDAKLLGLTITSDLNCYSFVTV
jgi:hypothetical protein